MPLKISRILHAGYVFEAGATTIAFDPIVENPFSRNCHAFPDVVFDHAQIRQLKFDAVFISHLHDDHLSLESLDFLDRATPIYLYCQFDQLFELVRALGFAQVHSLTIDVPIVVGDFVVTARKALESDVDSLFHIQADGLHVLNVVDAWMDPEVLPALARHAPWDMVLWPFQTMRETAVIAPSHATPGPVELPEEWSGQLAALAPRYIVPSSCQFVQEPWSWYNHAMFPVTYRQFQQEMEAALPSARVVRLNPSVSVMLDATSLTPAAPLPWVMPVGPQDVDFDYRPGAPPPSTAEIARHFAPLGAEETQLVIDFCASGLMEIYRELELPEDSYFQQPRLWQLTVYDHLGVATRWRYAIHGDRIEAVSQMDGALAWSTDVPLAKCHAALALGESLSSMYLRINDDAFDHATRAEQIDADIVDDPLIRCLFNDNLGAYQQAQLKRIQARLNE